MKKSVKTYVNEEKGVVVTKIIEVTKGFNFFDDIYDVYQGKAKCSPEDKFDVETGKKLSLARAWLKYDEAKLKDIREEKEDLEQELSELTKLELDQIELIERTQRRIEELTDSVED